MRKASISLVSDEILAHVDERLYGSFVEHFGRCVYGGIYQPGHPTADAEGFRSDTLALVRELSVPVVRYPGGNFVSGYRWEDGIGPKAGRPVRRDLAWRTLETNQVGVDEFVRWAEKSGTQVMMAVNLGTRGVDAARNLVEYCNSPTGSYYADLRAANGSVRPHGVKAWCLGNEMDGEWQIAHKDAREYAHVAREAAKAMRWVDESIELVACGSSSMQMSTYPEWDRIVLEECYDEVDYISLHAYYDNAERDTASFLSCPLAMEEQIRGIIAACDYVRAKKRGKKDIMLSFDEYNVGYHCRERDAELQRTPWQIAPPLAEDCYNVEDALVVGGLLITLLNHCDRVRMACMAQLVNVLAPIMTSDARVWKSTIFYPYYYFSRWGRGDALRLRTVCETFDCAARGDVPYLSAAAVIDEGELSLFLLNRADEEMLVTLQPNGFGELGEGTIVTLSDGDLCAANTEYEPNRVTPYSSTTLPGQRELRLPALSWSAVRLSARK